ncbi:threonine--tRNA ligase [Candidatus Bandiella euplotis]|uniref:Threonine--tRNA ligase n=1 Tax=Candidatus Bandiella euplotis TaxID=1664265 RepID=A0ABZ0ULI7_9RICK|nr:threonine--tRNA ligase [Candidatus Bandiella woodruffii]WPX96562.1 Threonine--tRNA ligase [Candidatus Bandiella woodruffii]
MNEIKLNGKIKELDQQKICGVELLSEIDKSLHKQCVAIKINGDVKDLSTEVVVGDDVEFVTSSSTEGLDIIRHDAAHIMAQAVKELYPSAQVTIGPTIENGFYYDFANVEPFSEADLEKIEAKMQSIIDQNLPIIRKVVTKEEAVDFFSKQGETYKVEIIGSLPQESQITIYTQGNFSDLCRGPHSPSTGVVKAFKLMKVAGAYWRGNSNNAMLQRIYGTAWADKKQLKQYLTMLEEAEKRDHRKIGKASDLFHFQEEAQGSVFWHPKGWDLFQRLLNYIREKQNNNGYLEISTPEIMDKKLWEASGHWEKFGENMFTANTIEEGRLYAVRPMNCPGGIQVYNQGIKSYRELPLRLAEFGKVHRYEPSGALHGLMRARAFTQDDAHIFCTNEQITEECIAVCKLIMEIYKDFGFNNVKVKFSDRPQKRIGSDEVWDSAEKALLNALVEQELPYTLNKGEGAFYGPKLEFVMRDAIGRDWQLGTLQVDFNLPERLDANYIDKDGKKYRPVMLHRALFGSIERFLGILIEHYSGNLPLWIAPTQVVIITVTDSINDYAKTVFSTLRTKGIRCTIDLENEKITYKIRKYSLEKVPMIAVLGEKEKEGNLVSIRKIGSNQQETLELNQFMDKLLLEIQQKRS